MQSIIIANWKMNTTVHEGLDLASKIRDGLGNNNVDVILCPPYTHLKPLFDELHGSSISLGAQNMHFEEKGAYTGAVSVTQIEEYCDYVILGHSEQRQYFGETDENVSKKIKTALKHCITPIVCVGESLATKKAGKSEEFVKNQLKNVFTPLKQSQNSKLQTQDLIIAYEPVWAISTNPGAKPDTPENAEKMVELIKNEVEEKYRINNISYKQSLSSLHSDKQSLKLNKFNFRYIYGGSVTGGNAAALAKMKDIEGALVGGASLNASEFVKIAKEFN